MIVSFVVSCGNKKTDEGINETESNKEETVGVTQGEEPQKEEPIRLSEEEKAKFHKLVEYDLPEGSFRDAIVDYMRKCSEIKWVAKEDFSMVDKFGDSWGVNLSYTKGTVYHGLPYTDYPVNYEYFEDELAKGDGKYFPRSFGWNEAPGLSCYSAIYIAHQQFEPYMGPVKSWIPGQETFWLEIVGGYEAPKDCLVTQDICDLNGRDKMYEAYAQLQKGDIIFDMNDIEYFNMHCRVVVGEPTIVKNGAGRVIPSRSYVTCIEQTNAFDKSRTDGVNTTWYVDHKYTFENLFDKGYVPYTLKAYSKPTSEMEVPYLGIDTEITSDVLSKGVISGMVKSNFPIHYVRVQILDKEGNEVFFKENGELYNKTKYSLRNYFGTVFDELEKGKEYTLILMAGIAPGNAELARVDFTYNK